MVFREVFTVALASLMLIAVTAQASNDWQRVEPVRNAIGDVTPLTTGLSLNLPLVAENGGEVPLELRFTGDLAEGEYLTRLQVLAPRNPKPDVIRFVLHSDRALPDLATRIRLSETQTVYALAESNRGTVWLTQQDIRVANSGCLMTNQDATEALMRNPRIALPRNLRAGTVGQFRTLINHPMETGIRTDGTEAPPQALIESLAVSNPEGPLLTAHFYTGTSANPYVLFSLRTTENEEELTFTWQDQQGKTLTETRRLTP